MMRDMKANVFLRGRVNSILCCLALFSIHHPVEAGDIANGSRLYGMFCMSCHGAGGKSVLPGAPNFSRGEALAKPDPILLASIKTGRVTMPAFSGVLSDREILDLISYLRTLR
jgi:cytochrome c6